MAKLILSLDGMVLREYPLSKERTTIGRKSHNDTLMGLSAMMGAVNFHELLDEMRKVL